MAKKKYTYKSKVKHIVISLPMYTDEYLQKFILDNSYMYNTIRNVFSEEANKFKGDYNMYYDFNPREFKTTYYNSIEKPENRYDYYCVGLSEQVAENFVKSKRTIQTKNKKILRKEIEGSLGEYKYKAFNFNRYSFRVKVKPDLLNGIVRGRFKVIDDSTVTFMVRANRYGRTKEVLTINLKEKLYDDIIKGDDPIFIKRYSSNGITNEYTFNLTDIKDVCFKYDCGKYYIQLFVQVTYYIDKSSRKYSKGKICGIDTGIRHPITIYDGNKTMYLSMDDKTTRKIHYLERRIKRLQRVLQVKYDYNQQHNISTHSNNIIKIVKKIRKLHRKIKNIKNFWIQNRCKEIATTYSKICVDRFEQPIHSDEEKKKISKKALRKINYANRFHKMYYFNEFLKHDCIKYGCEYIESPEDTTRTCSICGYVNEHLKLNDVCLDCANCHASIERDMNAARNCYDYLLDNA